MTALRKFGTFIVFSCLVLSGCGNKQIPFTDYLVENLLRENLGKLAEPAIFEVKSVLVNSKQSDGASGTATVDVELYFPEDFDTVVELRKLEPFNIEYLQYKSSFGKFEAGETQVHHARYQFENRSGKWMVTGSQAIAAPDVRKP